MYNRKLGQDMTVPINSRGTQTSRITSTPLTVQTDSRPQFNQETQTRPYQNQLPLKLFLLNQPQLHRLPPSIILSQQPLLEFNQ